MDLKYFICAGKIASLSCSHLILDTFYSYV